MWWTLAAALAGPNADRSLAVVLDYDASERQRVRAARALGRLDPSDPAVAEVVTPLAAELQSELPERLPGVIRKTLGRLDATAVWTTELESDDAATRERAANLLGQAGTPPAGGALVEVLDDPVADVREAAAGALSAYPDAEALQGLTGCLQDPALGVRLAAAQTLGFLATTEARDALRQARLTERDEVAQHYLDAALQHIRLKQAIP